VINATSKVVSIVSNVTQTRNGVQIGIVPIASSWFMEVRINVLNVGYNPLREDHRFDPEIGFVTVVVLILQVGWIVTYVVRRELCYHVSYQQHHGDNPIYEMFHNVQSVT
jgi:hypothetical protein